MFLLQLPFRVQLESETNDDTASGIVSGDETHLPIWQRKVHCKVLMPEELRVVLLVVIQTTK